MRVEQVAMLSRISALMSEVYQRYISTSEAMAWTLEEWLHQNQKVHLCQ